MTPDVLAPAGEGARHIANLAWFLFVAGTIVFVAVMMAFALAIRSSRKRGDPDADVRGGRRLQLVGGGLIPAAIVAVVFVLTERGITTLTLSARSDVTDVELIGRQWWWEVQYPQLGITSANEIHIPVGRPVRLTVRSPDVIHSFWVPRLHGKIDLVPGRTNALRLEATRPGTYRGQCAEYCGLQHTRMALQVVVHDPQSYDAWVHNERAVGISPTDTLLISGRGVFERVCASCHAVRGTLAAGARGPDLTHVASRAMLAAGTLPNTRDNLARWVANAEAIKPGSGMPRMPLAAGDLQAVVAYLESLR